MQRGFGEVVEREQAQLVWKWRDAATLVLVSWRHREVRGLSVYDDVVPIGGLEGHLGDFKKDFLMRSRRFI